MGNRLHYEKKHVIEYGDEECFNWMYEEIANLLSRYEVQMFSDEREDASYADNFYCPREEIESMVKKLNKRNKDRMCVEDAIWGTKYTCGEVAHFFDCALRKGEKNSDYIYFSWF